MLGFWAGELVQHPEWQDRVRAEVLAEFGTDDDLSLEKLETLQTLNATMKEVLRLYPAAPHGGQRTAFEDFDFRWKDPKTGQEKMIHFYKGDLILPSCFITNRHPENWPEHGDEFDPARWLKDPSGGSTHLFSYVPFGNGARKCLGERLAHNEGRLVMAGILRKYKIEPAKGWKLDIDQRAMLIPNGVQVKLVPL